MVVRLSGESGAEAFSKGKSETAARAAARAQQDAFLSRVQGIDSSARVLARVQMVMNAVFVQIDASKLAQIAADPAVVRVAPVANYELDLSETVPYIGAKAVQDAGVTGKGIKVAVLDSGIDYTHTAFGGAGAAAYAANNPAIIEPGTFPTGEGQGRLRLHRKRVDRWNGLTCRGARSRSARRRCARIRRTSASGHGSHVADIIGGKVGVAPGVDLYGVKVCATSTSSCSGISLIQGMEWTLDPNGDGSLKDRMHLINMSLGSTYGQPFDDDLSLAVENATKVGILTVASSGNSSDKPYVTGTPGAADSALSVAQTAVPSAFLPLMQILAPASIAGNVPAVFQPWSKPLDRRRSRGRSRSVGSDARRRQPEQRRSRDEPVSGGFAHREDRARRPRCVRLLGQDLQHRRGGGLLGIIGLIAPGDPFEGGVGAGDPTGSPAS